MPPALTRRTFLAGGAAVACSGADEECNPMMIANCIAIGSISTMGGGAAGPPAPPANAVTDPTLADEVVTDPTLADETVTDPTV